MCGIVGYFSTRHDLDPRRFAAANNLVRYRGPDGVGYISIDKDLNVVALRDEHMKDFERRSKPFGAIGFRRLSVIDLTAAGNQPMSDESGRYYIVHNGEVYNYVEVREELLSRGYAFRSGTDTEVVLKSYMEWGGDCLKRFNGMWSFCVLDRSRGVLFCSRDRFGIKPFYYYHDGELFIFGSEVKQVISLLPFSAAANDDVLFDYLVPGSYGNETRDTFFKGIMRLLPAESLTVDLRHADRIGMTQRAWWDLPADGASSIEGTDTGETIRALLEDSIRLRLRSDVPLGTCLSGGLDSSGITCLVDRMVRAKTTGGRHKVFVIGSSDPLLDETGYARMVIERTNVDAFFGTPAPVDLEQDLETFIWHHDEPLISGSMFGGWQVYKLARQSGVTVVLDGQGSDELLGGYYTGPHIRLLDDLLRDLRLDDFAEQLQQNSVLYRRNRIDLLLHVLLATMRRSAREAVPWSYHPGARKLARGWLNKDFVDDHIGRSRALNRDYCVGGRPFSSLIKRDIYELTKFTNLPGILRQVDRNSMAFSIEARVPFLDHRLVEFFYGLPVDHILRNGYTKYAYRQAMKGIIPEQVRLRTDKRGFAVAERELLNGAREHVRSILDRIPEKTGIYDADGIRTRIFGAIAHADLYDPIVWRIVNAILWQSIFHVH